MSAFEGFFSIAVPGELDYVEATSPVTVSGTTVGGATTLLTHNALTFDGSTIVYIEFFSPRVDGAVSLTDAIIGLYEDGTNIGWSEVQTTGNDGTMRKEAFISRRITPSAGSHTYSWRAWRGGANFTVSAGASGSDQQMPMYSRIVVVNPRHSTGVGSAWQTYTPTLTAVTTNPTLGSGSTSTGRWIRVGKLVIAIFTIEFGTGMNAGSGAYHVALPTAAGSTFDNTGFRFGHIHMTDEGTTRQGGAAPHLVDATKFQILQGNSALTVGHGQPWAWAAGDEIHGVLVYEVD